MRDGYREDLTDFARYGKLDAYELTDEDLARLLEVWRWSMWMEREPNGADHATIESTRRLQRHLAKHHDLEVEYNTALLLKQEAEPLMHLRVIMDFPKAVGYFLHLSRLWLFVQTLWRTWRYKQLAPAIDSRTNTRGYPRAALDAYTGRAPDLLKRRYWRQLSPHTFEERKRLDVWW